MVIRCCCCCCKDQRVAFRSRSSHAESCPTRLQHPNVRSTWWLSALQGTFHQKTCGIALMCFTSGLRCFPHGHAVASIWPTTRARQPGPHRQRCLMLSGLEFHLVFFVPKDSPRTECLAQACRATLHCRLGHRGLKSITESSTTRCLTVWGEALRDLVPLRPLCVPPTHTVGNSLFGSLSSRQQHGNV